MSLWWNWHKFFYSNRNELNRVESFCACDLKQLNEWNHSIFFSAARCDCYINRITNQLIKTWFSVDWNMQSYQRSVSNDVVDSRVHSLKCYFALNKCNGLALHSLIWTNKGNGSRRNGRGLNGPFLCLHICDSAQCFLTWAYNTYDASNIDAYVVIIAGRNCVVGDREWKNVAKHCVIHFHRNLQFILAIACHNHVPTRNLLTLEEFPLRAWTPTSSTFVNFEIDNLL